MSLSEPSRHAASIMNPIEGRLGYKFRNGLLLAEAMTHPSISLERKNYPVRQSALGILGRRRHSVGRDRTPLSTLS